MIVREPPGLSNTLLVQAYRLSALSPGSCCSAKRAARSAGLGVLRRVVPRVPCSRRVGLGVLRVLFSLFGMRLAARSDGSACCSRPVLSSHSLELNQSKPHAFYIGQFW